MSRYQNTEMIPAKPFADLLNARVEFWERRLSADGLPSDRGATVRVAHEFGWTDGESGIRRLYRLRFRTLESTTGRSKHSKGVRKISIAETFRRDLVEDALHHAGIQFADLYPDIAAAEDLELEPSKWCCGCREERTPINGVCPFCEWRLGPSTGQVLRGSKLPRSRKVSRKLAA
jgi:hypothetical protein